MINYYKLNLSKYSTHQLILNMIGSNKDVLDVGCNEGYIGKMADPSNSFYGIDKMVNAVKIANQYYKEVDICDLNERKELNFSIKKFDTIIMADILEHLLDPKAILVHYRKYLKDEGVLILSLPNVANWEIRLKLLFGSFKYTSTGILDKTHFHLYTYKTAVELASSAGYVVLTSQGGSSIFGVIIKLFPFLRSLLATGIILYCRKQ